MKFFDNRQFLAKHVLDYVTHGDVIGQSNLLSDADEFTATKRKFKLIKTLAC